MSSEKKALEDQENIYQWFRRIINYDLCIGCSTCEEVCSFIHEGKAYIKLYDVGGGLSRPISCFHCVQAPCVYACPTNAMHRDKDGIIKVDISRCIGCMACIAACPFGIPELVPPGYVAKCDLCEDLRKKGLDPACVATCPAQAITWGTGEVIASKLRTRVLKKILYTKTIP